MHSFETVCSDSTNVLAVVEIRLILRLPLTIYSPDLQALVVESTAPASGARLNDEISNVLAKIWYR